MGWMDVSMPLRDGMVHWPDDPPVRVRKVRDCALGDSCTLSMLTVSSHTGTHIDAPAHYLAGGAGVDTMPLEVGIGRARVIAIRDSTSIDLPELENRWTGRCERVLFKTRNSSFAHGAARFVRDFVSLTVEAAQFLVDRGVRLVGIDYLSVGSCQGDGDEVHRILLGAGIWIVEGLDLSRIPPGEYDMICLPLRLENGDGAPARIILSPL